MSSSTGSREGFILLGAFVLGSHLLRKRKRIELEDEPSWSMYIDEDLADTTAIEYPIAQRSQYGSLLLPEDNWRGCISTEEGAGEKCELCLVNETRMTCVLAWVDFNAGITTAHRVVQGGQILDGSVSNTHVEYGTAYHAFVIMRECAAGYPSTLSELSDEMIICCYRPEIGWKRHTLTLRLEEGTISCDVGVDPLVSWDDLIDTSEKVYHKQDICGFSVYIDPEAISNHPLLEEILERDLSTVKNLLPEAACELLRPSTAIWINDTFVYGPKSSPITGRGCCYHPARDWLANNRMTVEKAGCVEVYSISGYINDSNLWGVGGILMHELSHAYHDKFCVDGYGNSVVDSAYRQAMARGLYDRVQVHGPQGRDGPIKAYACSNRMEFWAELSVAYMWKKNNECEYNKWFPFNNQQFRSHDPESWAIFDKLWSMPHISKH